MGRGLPERQPALDGIRALAVGVVLLFHAGFGWMGGGYFGVSVFFTLSGYLITSLLLAERDRTGRVGLAAFYGRRARRLLPPSAICLTGIVIASWLGEFPHVASLRRDVMGAALQVFNWVELAGSSSYAQLFTDSTAFTSPVAHYWSLAIEEQFYLVWPLAVLVVVPLAARVRTSTLRILVLLTVMFGALAPVIAAVWGADAAYWATPARLGELLVGASLAAFLRTRSAEPPLGPRVATLLSGVCLTGIVVLCVALPSDRGPAFDGWMTPFALLTAGLIVGLQTAGPFRRALSLRPIVWVGGISYGLYLFHWPIFVVLRQHGWRLTEPSGFAVAVVLTFVAAVVSARLVERPIRVSTWRPRPVLIGAFATTLAVMLVATTLPRVPSLLEVDTETLEAAAIAPVDSLLPLDGAAVDLKPFAAGVALVDVTAGIDGPVDIPRPVDLWTNDGTGPVGDESVSPDPAILDVVVVAPQTPVLPERPNRPVRVMVVGDSTALYTGQGLADWANRHPGYLQVDIVWTPGLGLITSGTVTSWDATAAVARSAEILADDLPERLDRLQPDIVMFMVTMNDVLDRQWPDEVVMSPVDDSYRERMLDAYRQANQLVADHDVATVAWVVPPAPGDWVSAAVLAEGDRFESQAGVIRQVADEATSPGPVFELDAWLAANVDDERWWRPDATHMTRESAARLAELYLGPAVVAAALSGSEP